MRQAALTQELPRRPEPFQPPLKWAGGKRWLVPHLRPLWEPSQTERLVEPFAGGLAATFDFQPKQVLANDFNPHLINFYNWLQRGLRLTVPHGTDADTYYGNRTRFNELVREDKGGSREAAMLFYYLNRNCYNGLCRFNKKGEFNTPHGRYKNPQYLTDLTSYKGPLQSWKFQAGDFEKIRLNDGDFVFADPPYDAAFTSYSAGEFGWDDQRRLAQWLSGHPGPVVASNHATSRIVKLYKGHGFKVKLLPAPRMINCTGDRTPALEMVATLNV